MDRFSGRIEVVRMKNELDDWDQIDIKKRKKSRTGYFLILFGSLVVLAVVIFAGIL